MLFGRQEQVASECEITDSAKPYLFGKVRVRFGGLALGDFSGEIVATYKFAVEQLWEIGQQAPVPIELAECPAEVCIRELGGRWARPGASEQDADRWRSYDFTNVFPYFGRTLCLLLPLDSGHRIVLGLSSGTVHEVKLEAGELEAACLGFVDWVQAQPGYRAG